METFSVSDIISTYSKFINKAIRQYAEKYRISSNSARNLERLTPLEITYCIHKTADLLLQIPEFNNGAERGQIPEFDNDAERGQESLKEEKYFKQEKCMELARMHQSSPAPSKVANRDKKAFQVFDCHNFGQEFCKWFYSWLNSQNPAYGWERLDWKPNNFWRDVKFSIAHDDSFEQYIGDECVTSKLLEMTQEQKLTFTPELDNERFKCVKSKDGVVVVAVTGAISNNDDYSGVFRQIFGLIKCPYTGSYKIKSTDIKVDTNNPKRRFQGSPLQYTPAQRQGLKI